MISWRKYRWAPHDWDYDFGDGELAWDFVLNEMEFVDWSFVELTSGDDLFREGLALRHCVASYAARCAAGHSAIVSARFDDERRLTIEVEPRTRRIVQVRGFENRQATEEEWEVISCWAEKVVKPRVDE